MLPKWVKKAILSTTLSELLRFVIRLSLTRTTHASQGHILVAAAPLAPLLEGAREARCLTAG